MIKRDFHVHTNFCDGENTPEEMVKKAINLGLTEIGLVCHSYTPFDESYCVKRENIDKFIAQINSLKTKYSGKIAVYCGVEYDYFAEMSTEEFDFIIGSVHYIYKDGKYLAIDESKELVIDIVNGYFNGDFYAFCESYYETLSNIYSKVNPSFIGHFDLVSKYNKDFVFFDEKDKRYITAWKKCADKLLSKKAVFEINTGALCRGYQNRPYLSIEQTEYLKAKGASFILNSDSHSLSMLEASFNLEIPNEIKNLI